jgi:hypothetical protein
MKFTKTEASRVWLAIPPLSLLLSACGGGGGDGSPEATGPTPILQVGMQRQYVGTATRSVVYSTPSATSPNNTLAYSFTENQSVLQAAGSTGASFDVNSTYTYTVTQDPGFGTVPISQTVDTYENLLISGASQMTQTIGQNATVTSNDETANALGGGPYMQTTTTQTTYPTTRDGFSFPLQTGATMNVPQSASQNISFSDLNAAGAAPPNGSNVGYSRTRTENNDGSYAYQTTDVNGDTLNDTENADGTGNYTFGTATNTTTTTLGTPDLASAGNTLPVTRADETISTGVTTTTNYVAADWYSNGGSPNSPLILQAEQVVGPATTLPTECTGALVRPNVYEIDTTTTSQNTLSPSYSTTTTRSFNADGVVVCSMSQETAYSYDLLTGALVSTTTTQTQMTLNAINY